MANQKISLETKRHSCSHLMAAAIGQLYPQAQFGIGPAVENGFYYDIELPTKVSEEDLPKIEEKMRDLAAQNLKFEKKEVPVKKGLEAVRDLGQKYKTELIEKFAAEGKKTVVFYRLGDFVDLCSGPHVASTKQIGFFKLLSVAGAYWQGNEKKQMLTRIYGTCFSTKKELEEYLIRLEEAKKRDHRVIGAEQKLFMFDDEVGQGLPLYLPNGAMIRHLLIEYAFNTYLKRGYQPVSTPHIGTESLWQHSGHLDYYAESMYGPMVIDKKRYRLKPMNCPFHVKIYNSELRSYRDLPLRFTEMGTVYRYEKSGELHGLTRPRAFTQDDAHIICTPEQLESEIISALKLTREIYQKLEMTDLIYKLSVRDPKNLGKYLGTKKGWDQAEKTLKKSLLAVGQKTYETDIGGAAFYAPKIDIDVVDSTGHRWQLSTIQVDFILPGRFKMNFIDQTGKKKTPFMIHRALLGSLERFLGVYIEHTGGEFPFWLSPVQVKIIPVTDQHIPYAEKVAKMLSDRDIRVETDVRTQTTSAKVRLAVIQRIPYLLVVGDREKAAHTVSVRERGSEKTQVMKIAEFLKTMAKQPKK